MMDKRLLAAARPYRRSLILLGSSSFVIAGLIVAQAWLLSRVISGAFLDHAPLVASWRLLAFYVMASLLRVAISWYRATQASHLAVKVKEGLRARLLRHLHALGPRAQTQTPRGETTWILTEGVGRLETWFRDYLPQVISAAFIPLTLLFFIVPIEGLTGIVLLITAPLIPLFMVLIGDLAKARTKRQWKTLSRMSGHFLDVLQGLQTLKLLGRSRDAGIKIREIAEAFRDQTLGVLRVAFLSALVLELITTLSTAVVAVEVGVRLLYGKMSFAPALFVLILAPEFYLPLRLLGLRFHAGMDGVEAAARIFAIQALPLRASVGEALPLPEGPLRVELRGVSVRYEDAAADALEEVDLHLGAGETTVLVGASGSGKSTLVRLLLREIAPTRGALSMSGVAATSIAEDRWLAKIAWVPQRPHLFARTLGDNLRVARPDATEEELHRALDVARLGRWFAKLPRGLATPLGEDGTRLSDGERQRLAIARALLKDAPLVIFDEHVSNLDPESEGALQEALGEICRDKTVLIVAHRLSTILRGDRVVVLEAGRVVEEGSPAELRRRGGIVATWIETAEAAS